MKQLNALLIGINSYINYPLEGCINDVNNIEKYLIEKLSTRFENNIHITKLLNEEATKENVIKNILDLKGASNDSTALIYFSGHGTQEETGGRFKDEYDGLLECLVCYEEKKANNLLADKEIRYLLNQFTNNPHLVTIFDCCHSGDMTKAPPGDKEESTTRKIFGSNAPRDYFDFCFSEVIDENELRNKPTFFALGEIKNHIHIAACLSHELSTERTQTSPFKQEQSEKQGILTKYLIDFLLVSNSNINYEEITKWAQISFKDVTSSKQTPNAKVFGKGNLSALSGWLGVAELKNRDLKATRIYPNDMNGWYLDKGKLWGIEKGMKISIDVGNGTTHEAAITEVDLNKSLIDSFTLIGKLDLSKKDGYKASLQDNKTIHGNLRIYINDIDQDDSEIVTKIEQVLQNMDKVTLSNKELSDVYLTIFNKTIFFNFGEDYYQFKPFTKQLDLLQDKLDIKELLNYQVPYIQNWFFLKKLKNPALSYQKSPIKIEIIRYGDEEWNEIPNNGVHQFIPNKTYRNISYGSYNLKITRTKRGDKPLFVGAYVLWADMSVDIEPLGVLNLSSNGESVEFYREKGTGGKFQLDEDKEFYNWKSEPAHIRFIVSDNIFTIDDLRQAALEGPIMIDTAAGGGNDIPIDNYHNPWQVYTANIEIINPTYNEITGVLKDYLSEVEDNELLSGFIQENYINYQQVGTTFEPVLKQNKNQTSKEATKATSSRVIRFLNKVFNRRRNRKFKKRLKNNNLPIIVAEGDSWFLLPDPRIKDTLSYINITYNVRSLADAGDELKDYYNNGQFIGEIAKLKPNIILLSGGGNDVIGEQVQDILISNLPAGLPGDNYIDIKKFQLKMEELEKNYRYFITSLQAILSQKEEKSHLFIHGYDYIKSNPKPKFIEGGWANRYMIAAGINKPEDREKVIKILIDKFNQMLENLASKYKDFVVYVNNRETVGDNEWYDEIHPNSKGYQKVAMNFLTAINKTKNPS